MTLNEPDDQLLRDLRRLPVHSQHEKRAERVRTRCRAALGRRQRRMERSTRRARFTRRLFEPVLVGGLSFAYLLAVILDLLRLY